jgi:hypothetical protein
MTLQRVSDWLKTLKKAELLNSGSDPICPMILYMEDGTTQSMKISPAVRIDNIDHCFISPRVC